jgi:hypothetical protein
VSDICLWVEHSQCVFAAVELFNEEEIAKEEKCPNNIYRNYLSYCAKTKRFEGECIISFWQNHEHISKTKAKLQRFCFYCIVHKNEMNQEVPSTKLSLAPQKESVHPSHTQCISRQLHTSQTINFTDRSFGLLLFFVSCCSFSSSSRESDYLDRRDEIKSSPPHHNILVLEKYPKFDTIGIGKNRMHGTYYRSE